MNEINEALKGFTDLPIAVISAVFWYLSKKREKIKGFSALFSLISLAAFLGAAVHIIKLTDFSKNLVWVGLYLLLFEAVRRFSSLFCAYIEKREPQEYHLTFLCEILCYAAAVVTMIFFNRFDMLFFALFAVLMLIRVFVSILKCKKIPKKVLILLITLPLLILLQVFSFIIPYAVVFEHFIIAALLFTVYLISKE